MAKQKSVKQKITSKRKVAFSFAAPEAQTVSLAGDFTDWQQAPISLKKDKDGLWKGTVALLPGNYEYRFLVDGEWRDDPACAERRPNTFGTENCVCVVAG